MEQLLVLLTRGVGALEAIAQAVTKQAAQEALPVRIVLSGGPVVVPAPVPAEPAPTPQPTPEPGTPSEPSGPADPSKVEPIPGPAEPEPAPQPEAPKPQPEAPKPQPEAPKPQPEAPAPKPEPTPAPKPEPTPAPEPEPAPAPEPAPQPSTGVQLLSGMLAPGKMERVSGDWKKGMLALPTWHNGVHTQGNAKMVSFDPADGSALLTASHVGKVWNSGELQVDRPKAGRGRWSFIAASENPGAVPALFTYCNDSQTEIDWEYGAKNGVAGFHLSLHMPKNAGGRFSLGGFTPFSREQWKRPTRFEFELGDETCQWFIDGGLVHTIRKADIPKGEGWKLDAKMFAMASVEKHGDWAGVKTYDRGEMRVYGIRVPGMAA